MKCPQCGHQNAKHYKFCLECGAEIPSVNLESPKPTSPKRVGIADAFEAAPVRNPSPETLIRQVEDLSSDIGLGSPLTTPPKGGLKSGNLSKAISSDEVKAQSPLSSSLMSNASRSRPPINEYGSPPIKNPLLKEHLASPDLEFHTNLSGGRDSLASFEGEFFGELEQYRSNPESAAAAVHQVEEESAPPPVPEVDQSASDPSMNVVIPKVEEVSALPSNPETPKICKSCGADIPKDFLFCGRCGAKVEIDVEEEAVQAQVASVIEEKPAVSEVSIPIIEESPSVSATDLPPVVDLMPEHVSEQKVDIVAEVPQSYLTLIHIHLDGSEGDQCSVNEDNHILGRGHSWEVFQSDEYLSNEHAKLSYNEEGQIILEDLGGINGVFLRLTRPVPLSHGDYFRAGQQLFAFERIETVPSVDQQKTKMLGSPSYDAWGRLVHVVGQGEVGRAWLMHNEHVILGRVRGDIIFDQDRFMSGKHCALSSAKGEIVLTDQGSTNGSFIRIREQIILEDEDLILLGQKIFKVRFNHT